MHAIDGVGKLQHASTAVPGMRHKACRHGGCDLGAAISVDYLRTVG